MRAGMDELSRTLAFEMAAEEGPVAAGGVGQHAAPMGVGVAGASDDLELPEQEFIYLVGSTDRPWQHFKGRWKAIKPYLADMLASCGSNRPLRIADVGSCTGFFSLQAAYRHPEADIIAIEGSVGIGNGTAGMAGSTKQILSTYAVQTHLRWVNRLGLANCFLAPEVWDYIHVCELAALGKPICDVMLLLSVIHHIDGVSAQQYTAAGLSRLDGTIDLVAKLLLLAPRHFVELPNTPWLASAYEAYGTARGILQAAASASGHNWRFSGPIYSAEWFGLREVWVVEVESPMPQVDVQSCPFPLLCRDSEPLPTEPELVGEGQRVLPPLPAQALPPVPAQGAPAVAAGASWDSAAKDIGAFMDSAAKDIANTPTRSILGGLVDPGLMMLSDERYGPPSDHVVEALIQAPTALLVAHLTLRDAITEAQDVLKEFRSPLMDERQGRKGPPAPRPAGSAYEQVPPPPYGRPAVAAAAGRRGGPMYMPPQRL